MTVSVEILVLLGILAVNSVLHAISQVLLVRRVNALCESAGA